MVVDGRRAYDVSGSTQGSLFRRWSDFCREGIRALVGYFAPGHIQRDLDSGSSSATRFLVAIPELERRAGSKDSVLLAAGG